MKTYFKDSSFFASNEAQKPTLKEKLQEMNRRQIEKLKDLAKDMAPGKHRDQIETQIATSERESGIEAE